MRAKEAKAHDTRGASRASGLGIGCGHSVRALATTATDQHARADRRNGAITSPWTAKTPNVARLFVSAARHGQARGTSYRTAAGYWIAMKSKQHRNGPHFVWFQRKGTLQLPLHCYA